MKKPLVITIALVAALVGLVYLLTQHDQPIDPTAEELTVHCAAGLQKPVNEIAKQYEADFGTRIKLNFAGSGVLESQLQIAGGDIFIPADYSYIERTRELGLVQEALPLAELRAVIVVAKGNPRNITSLAGLQQSGVRVCVAEPSAAVGKFIRKILTQSGDWDKIKPQVVVTQPTVNGVIDTVATGSVDAALAWDAVAGQFEDVEIIRVPLLESKPRSATVGVLKNATTPAALHFARYLSAEEKGRKVFAKYGFSVPKEADMLVNIPELTLFSGSMLKPAISDLIKAFEKREGCRVKTVYDGCGTLVSMMKGGGAKPSAYFSCDSSFLIDVQDQFHPGTVVSSNVIVLLVPKGNPKQFKNLQSLTRSGLKIGVADPRKSALGKLTQKMLEKYQMAAAVKPNIVVLVSKGDELVNQMQANALDAALVYKSNALASEYIMKNCEVIMLKNPESFATQPYAVSRSTPHPAMMGRLLDTLTSDDAKKHYEKLGFTWMIKE